MCRYVQCPEVLRTIMIRRTKTVNLSRGYLTDQTSLAAVGVAAHECGHAIQHAIDYAPLEIPKCDCSCGKFWKYTCPGRCFLIGLIMQVSVL